MRILVLHVEVCHDFLCMMQMADWANLDWAREGGAVRHWHALCPPARQPCMVCHVANIFRAIIKKHVGETAMGTGRN